MISLGKKMKVPAYSSSSSCTDITFTESYRYQDVNIAMRIESVCMSPLALCHGKTRPVPLAVYNAFDSGPGRFRSAWHCVDSTQRRKHIHDRK